MTMLDAHMLACVPCASANEPCPTGVALMAQDQFDESMDDHRRRLHNPADPYAEPCCADCCDCAYAIGDPPDAE